ncbi:hypothetical protein BH11PLA2_BH11PLA2_51050 [soil metagenome]
MLAAATLLLVVDRGATQDPDRAKSVTEWLVVLEGKNSVRNAHDIATARAALGPDGPFVKSAVPALIVALTEEYGARDDIIAILTEYGSAAVPDLVGALNRADPFIRAGSAAALGSIRPRPPEVLPALLGAVKDSAPLVRQSVAGGLSGMRQHADKILPPLLMLATDPEAEVRAPAVRALAKLYRTPGPAFVAVIAALKDKDEMVRSTAVGAMWTAGPVVATAVPALTEALRDSRDSQFQVLVAMTLGRVGPLAKDAVPQLLVALKGKDENLVKAAASALGEIGPAAKDAVPRLLGLLKAKPNDLSEIAVVALGQIGPASKDAVTFLLAELVDNNPDDSLIDALGGIGPDAKVAVSRLSAIARNRKVDAWKRGHAARAVAAIDPAAFARDKLEFAGFDIRPGSVQTVALKPRLPATVEQKARIKKLIADLARMDQPDFGLSATLTGTAFAPLPGLAKLQVGLITDHKLDTSDAFRKLIELGPDAIPFLLDALDDTTPTRLKIKRSGTMMFGVGGSLPEGNPFNKAEAKAVALKTLDEQDDDEGEAGGYTVKVGDVCFVALGQIAGRPYRAVQYIPSGIVSVNSASQSRDLRAKLRKAWGGPDPARVLLDSLLTDYATEGVFNGSSLDGWDEGSEYQIEAAVRLAYYFPEEAGPVIAARLKALDVKAPGMVDDGSMMRDVRNRMRTVEFLKVVSWSKAGAIREAIIDVAKRTDDLEIRKLLATDAK